MKRSRVIYFIIGVVALLVLNILLMNFISTAEVAQKEQLLDQSRSHFQMKSVQVEAELHQLSNHLSSIYAFVEATRDTEDFGARFNQFAASNLALFEGIRNYSVAPDGVQTYVYPVNGNEATIGHNLYSDSRESVQDSLQRMRESRSIVTSGPYNLRQGGRGLILRAPIYDGDKLWGVVNAVMDIDHLVESLELDQDPYFYYSLGTDQSFFYFSSPFAGEDLQSTSIAYYDTKILFQGEPKALLLQSTASGYTWIRWLGILSLATIFALYTLLLMRNQHLDERLLHSSYYDALTELPNRRKMNEDLERLLGIADPFYLVYLDIDNFKELNDVYGHSTGDELLMEFSKRLRQMVSPPNQCFRWGGDEFILVYAMPANESMKLDLESFLMHLEENLCAEYHLGAIRYPLRISMGISHYPKLGAKIDRLIQQADTAMYHAKSLEGTTYAYYENEMLEKSEKSMQISLDLRRVLKEKALTAYFQPQIEISSGRIIGAEALARWLDDQGTVIHAPNEFIPVAEQTGLIRQVSLCILQQSINLIAHIREQFKIDFPIAVNLAGTEIDEDLIQWIHKAMDDKGLPYSLLEFEITERMAVAAIPKMYEHLNTLRSEDFRISLDDFGTSQSTLRLLQDLPIDIIKIDRRFVNGLVSKKTRDATIIRSILVLAKELELDVVAEGVETKQQDTLLDDFGCRYAQGFFYHRPLAKKDLLKLLKANPL